MNQVTQILRALQQGDRQAAGDLLPVVYDELRKLAAHRLCQEAPGQTLQPTALVHEAYLRLVDAQGAGEWDGRGHFFAAAAEAMRRILVDGARRKRSLKGGGVRRREALDHVELAIEPPPVIDLLALDEALARLERTEPRKAAVVKLRFFAGLSNEEAADALGICGSTADNDWAYARAWLRLEMAGPAAKPVAQDTPVR
jgi:RNA polymerase sigma factor (TIGR02999 family)